MSLEELKNLDVTLSIKGTTEAILRVIDTLSGGPGDGAALDLIRKKSILECDIVLTGERFKINKIEILKHKIESLKMNFGDGLTIDKSLVHLSKWLGFQLKIKELKVVEFYEIVNEYGARTN